MLTKSLISNNYSSHNNQKVTIITIEKQIATNNQQHVQRNLTASKIFANVNNKLQCRTTYKG